MNNSLEKSITLLVLCAGSLPTIYGQYKVRKINSKRAGQRLVVGVGWTSGF